MKTAHLATTVCFPGFPVLRVQRLSRVRQPWHGAPNTGKTFTSAKKSDRAEEWDSASSMVEQVTMRHMLIMLMHWFASQGHCPKPWLWLQEVSWTNIHQNPSSRTTLDYLLRSLDLSSCCAILVALRMAALLPSPVQRSVQWKSWRRNRSRLGWPVSTVVWGILEYSRIPDAPKNPHNFI